MLWQNGRSLTMSPDVVMTGARVLANRHVVRIGKTEWVVPVGRSFLIDLAEDRPRIYRCATHFVKTCKLSVVYILQSLESRHPGGFEPTLGRA
jgi:hypothetical protein